MACTRLEHTPLYTHFDKNGRVAVTDDFGNLVLAGYIQARFSLYGLATQYNRFHGDH